MTIRILLVWFIFGFLSRLFAQEPSLQWVDSVLSSMSIEEKIGQLYMIRAHSNLTEDHVKSVKQQIRKYQVGGVCFFQGTPEKQHQLCNDYQSTSSLPLLVAMDAEWGPSMRLKGNVVSYPRQLMLGAIQDNSLLYRFGAEVGEQLRALGVHVNFAPVVDININPDNPVINDRSFGEDKYNVTTKSYMYMRGMQEKNVMACAKHFPGHGDTDTDSHHDLPIIPFDRKRLDNIEMFPFQVLSSQGLQSVMVAHLEVPSLDDTKALPSSLSQKIVTNVLQDEIGFEGLIFTDGLEMKGVTKHFSPGELELQAIHAGNDVLLLPNNIEATHEYLIKAVKNGQLTVDRLDHSVKKILLTKYQLGLKSKVDVDNNDLGKTLTSNRAKALRRELIEHSVTLVRNKADLIPIQEHDGNLKIISFGSTEPTAFQRELSKHFATTRHNYPLAISSKQRNDIVADIKANDVVIVSLHQMKKLSRDQFGISNELLTTLTEIDAKSELVLVVFGNPYSLKLFQSVENIVMAYEDNELTQEITGQGIAGVIGFRGRLPVTADSISHFGAGVTTVGDLRMGHALPERVGMNSDTLAKIDQVVSEIMRRQAAPGCQILVAKDNRIVFSKAYGYHTYERKQPVLPFHMYDLASVTKIASTTLSVMKLYEEGRLHLELPVIEYLPELRGSNKAFMNLLDIMSHHSGLLPWIPFYRSTLSENSPIRPSPKYYKTSRTDSFSIQVSDQLFLRNDYRDSIYLQIRESDLRRNRNYRYSDLGFYLISEIIKEISDQSISEYCNQNFYKPLGLQKTTYNPHQYFPIKEIVPSEEDQYFRRDRVQGYVHDMGAAMLGGVSGHAGLFSNAQDLAVLAQMLLNGGQYAGKCYLQPETIERFANRHPMSYRRGIGFDMKDLDDDSKPNVSMYASKKAYGHYGFTGTAMWIDPEYNLIFIFLSNRTYPRMTNNRLNREEYRIKIQDLIYRSFMNIDVS